MSVQEARALVERLPRAVQLRRDVAERLRSRQRKALCFAASLLRVGDVLPGLAHRLRVLATGALERYKLDGFWNDEARTRDAFREDDSPSLGPSVATT